MRNKNEETLMFVVLAKVFSCIIRLLSWSFYHILEFGLLLLGEIVM